MQGDTRLEPVAYDPRQAAGVPSLQRAERLARAHGHKIAYFRDPSGTSGVNGALIGDTLVLNIDSLIDPLHATAGHEITHAMENQAPEIYGPFADLVEQLSRGRRGDYIENRLRRGYRRRDLRSELVADFVGETLTDPRQIEAALRDNPTLMQRVMTWIADYIDKLKRQLGRGGEAGGTTARATIADLEKAQRAMRTALRTWRATGAGSRRGAADYSPRKPAEVSGGGPVATAGAMFSRGEGRLARSERKWTDAQMVAMIDQKVKARHNIEDNPHPRQTLPLSVDKRVKS